MYDFNSIGDMLLHTTYNDFDSTVNVCNMLKEEAFKNDVLVKPEFKTLIIKYLTLKDDYQELRTYSLLSACGEEGSIKYGNLEPYMCKGFLYEIEKKKILTNMTLEVTSIMQECYTKGNTYIKDILLLFDQSLLTLEYVFVTDLIERYKIALAVNPDGKGTSHECAQEVIVTASDESAYANETSFSLLKFICPLVEEILHHHTNDEQLDEELLRLKTELSSLSPYEKKSKIKDWSRMTY